MEVRFGELALPLFIFLTMANVGTTQDPVRIVKYWRATILVAPLVLPSLLTRLSVDGGAMVWTLVRQLLLPIVLGGLLAHFLPDLDRRLQPWVAKKVAAP